MSAESPLQDLGAQSRLAPVVTPRGHLLLRTEDDAPPLERALAERLVRAFARGGGHGLLWLGAAEVGTPLPGSLAFFREFASRYITALCAAPDAEVLPAGVPPPVQELAALVAAAPPITGAELLSVELLRALWVELDLAFREELRAGTSVLALLRGLNPAWNQIGRVHFHLAESHRDEALPFAFLATYSQKLNSQGKPLHLPLSHAQRTLAGPAHRDRLFALLLPVQQAADRCPWLRSLLQSGELYQPLRWSPSEALKLLDDVPILEAAGIAVRVPQSWPLGRPPRPRIQATIGGKTPRGIGQGALVDFRLEVALDGAPLSDEELARLFESTEGLVFLRGRWVEVDRRRLVRLLERFRAVERTAAERGLPFAQAMRLFTGMSDATADETPPEPDSAAWTQFAAGPWLAETLGCLVQPERLAPVACDGLRASLRPYQELGVRWLCEVTRLGFGACLADDMGLGKTIQVLALLLARRSERTQPSLLVVPASLLRNWAIELERFAPTLATLVLHPSALRFQALVQLGQAELAGVDLVITSYGALLRLPWLTTTAWDLLILDEAQAIKNPGAKQSRAVKKLTAHARLALTGTPIENRLMDLWSIFDFLNPGLLGSARTFERLARTVQNEPHAFGPLRSLVRPFILRRLKTDRAIIQDLPEKTEVRAFCALTRKQAALYQQAVSDLERALAHAEGIRRRGAVLRALTCFKQICNHPSHWLGDAEWAEADSGKLQRLRELCEVLRARQEKALVFTQFREATEPLAAFLAGVFGRPGLVLNGQTEVGRRQELVDRFQADEEVPFFVLSLRAGGAGLNLTAATHVIHFDRWWNPAVENQATDRAFRIGQTRNVLVHKFLCRGTIEEKIDRLLESKARLAADLLPKTAEQLLTELPSPELIQLAALEPESVLED